MFEFFVSQLFNGITLGSIYALIALGYTMVYGILFMINFAHSEIFMLGAYISLGIFIIVSTLTAYFGIVIPLAVIVASMIVGIIGVIVELVAYRPLRSSPRLTPLISAISVSIILQNIVFIFVSNYAISYNIISDLLPSGNFLGFEYKGMIITLITITLMVILALFLSKSKFGIAIRATSQDRNTASLMGINVNMIISLVFFIGAFLGAVGGFFYGAYYSMIRYDMGFIPGIKAFTAAVVGGIGSIPGAVLGGFLIGIFEIFAESYISSTYKDVIVYSLLILTLLLKPEGILGERSIDKI
ncbi:MAG: branched-chain amino acid ABC transporter permease [Spirochaetia bacterium]|nr:branched-chain amino acid ABC transporter permease [Spirochaetota bacterium]MCX8097152.1 branched-chain amino acid ABC transporter permease [Spirochaetota bacterium]MDW8113096.1 branched-chain amino acid ABC transporter permease [Spirochaetia bacterium]